MSANRIISGSGFRHTPRCRPTSVVRATPQTERRAARMCAQELTRIIQGHGDASRHMTAWVRVSGQKYQQIVRQVEVWPESLMFQYVRVGSLFFADEELVGQGAEQGLSANHFVVPQMKLSMIGDYDNVKFHLFSDLLALEAMRLNPGCTVVDAGSGDGFLSLAALRWGARRAVLIDNDLRRIDQARVLLQRNGYRENQDFFIIYGHLGATEAIVKDFPSLTQEVVFFATIGDFDCYKPASNRMCMDLALALQESGKARINKLLLGSYNHNPVNRPDLDLRVASNCGFSKLEVEAKLIFGEARGFTQAFVLAK